MKREGIVKRAYVCGALFIPLCLFPFILCADDYGIVWADTIDNGDWDGASSIAVDNADNIIVAGCSFIGGDNDYFIVKYDSSGTILWEDTLDNGGEDYAEDVAVDNSNNIIVTGYSMIGGDYDYYTVKYDPYGTILWEDTLDNNGLYDIGRGVAVDNANNIVVTGYCDIGGDCVYFTVKYDPGGSIIWADTLDYGLFDSAFDVAIDDANNIIVTGYTSDGANNDYFTVKYDSSGAILWQRAIDIYEFDQAYGVTVDNSNNIIVSGCSGGAFDDYDYFTVKYDPGGNIIWSDTLDNGDNDDVAYCVAVDSGSSIYVTGYTLEPSGDYDYFHVKYATNGAIVWQDTLNNGDNDIAYGIVVDSWGDIVVTGRSYIAGDFDYFTVKYAPLPGVSDGNEPVGIYGVLQCSVFPNPFKDKIELRLHWGSGNRRDGETVIQIYDVSGRMVRDFVLYPSSFILGVTWDGTDDFGNLLPGGVYYLIFGTRSCKETRKLLLVR
jgi:uncharacterized delta-60 repeat protein